MRLIVTVIGLFLSGFADAEDVSITVFEDHKRYVNASDSYGLSWSLIALAAERKGIRLIPYESSWRASINRLQAHRVDLVFAALKTPEREEWAHYSVPLANEGSAIFARLDNPVQAFEDIDLANSVIGVSANSAQETLARELGFENIYSTVRRPQLYDMLEKGRLDYLFFGKSVIGYYCLHFANSDTKNCMKQIGPLYLRNNVHTISMQNNRQAVAKLEKLNEGLIEISRLEQTKALFVRYGKSPEFYQQWLTQLENDLKRRNAP